ncbi:MAG TPA: TnsD family Tn7-like transposition protein [Acidiphilium sp.]|uniref:TnsD family Tn7-like transposition protein n=1 Tax=unclassified Acidiphilium TaxID=2617493 RepID=UPI000BCE835A|nr:MULTISPECIES: TnsD family Tn7-like transposition protein [unclassified Acidiphilium]OYV55642.1 MAG: hypothetical protein B7Z76_09300 [Acidiphilium sp. 20-67-58]HQT61412.1 TnsD family Tn7-like transposition protein [Acidiphilium sp.]HQU10153.1 TnsD family Tn7-like transposition protein [Acidiphilium sp.]
MLAYFPQVYPGELLYSVLARYHRHMGAPSSIQSMESLYGHRLVVASVDLPGHLQSLVDRLPPGSGWTVDRVIEELTLFPYYTAFQPPGVVNRVRAAMRNGVTNGMLLRLGIAAFRAGHVTQLRFCPACLTEMEKCPGEPYWRRDHQLPGVLVCPTHGCPLKASAVSLTGFGRHIYVAATKRSCPNDSPDLVAGNDYLLLTKLERLAGASRALLEKPGPIRTTQEWSKHYRGALLRSGLTLSSGRLDQRRLEQAFFENYAGVLRLLPELTVGAFRPGPWLTAMSRKHRHAFHPFQHVLLQDFLDRQLRIDGPFGDGPWACPNPLAPHRSRLTISEVRIHRNHGHLVGVFACKCGYIYTRSLFLERQVLGPPRFQAYGPLLAPALREAVDSGISLRSLARRLELDPKTVVKLAVELGIGTRWKTPPGYCSAASCVGRTTASHRRVPPVSRRSASPHFRRDWDVVDREAGIKILLATLHLLTQEPPVRITRSQIERTTWNRGWLAKRAGKLPHAMGCLRDVVESVDQFQERRTRHIIREMDRAGEPLAAWRVLRRAGLTSAREHLVQTLLAEHFETPRVATA